MIDLNVSALRAGDEEMRPRADFAKFGFRSCDCSRPVSWRWFRAEVSET